MKTLRKIRKNAKALSPVVASIILIAVTVAVSIAVAAWMGALTVGFMSTEEVKITSVKFTATTITLTVNNTGTSPVTLSQAWVNNVQMSSVTGLNSAISANSGTQIVITTSVTDGYNYQLKLISAQGNSFLYTAVAPAT
jgi:flagellin-like protein